MLKLHILTILLLIFSWGCNSSLQPQESSQLKKELSQSQDIIIHIITDGEIPFQSLTADIQRNGNTSTIFCRDNGGNDYDQPNDGIYVCVSEGGYAQYININIIGITQNNQKNSLFSGLLRSNDINQNNFGFHLTKGINKYLLLRTANSSTEGSYSMKDQVWRFILLTYGLLIFLYFGILWLHRRN